MTLMLIDPHRRKYSTQSQSDHEITPLVRLWLLRLLVPLKLNSNLILKEEFSNNLIAEKIGLTGQPDDPEDGHNPKELRAKLCRLYREAESDSKSAKPPENLVKNIARLRELVNLSETDCRILEFTVILRTEYLLEETSDWLGDITSVKVANVLSVLLRLHESDVRASLNGKNILARSGLVSVDRTEMQRLRHKLELLTCDFADDIISSEIDPMELIRERVVLSNPPKLTLSDYGHISESIKILHPYLINAIEKKRNGVNIFIHGMPGTGKSELTKVLAKEIGCELFEVSCEDEEGDPVAGVGRLRAFNAAQSFLSQRRALILFDEVEDVFKNGGVLQPSTAQTNKGWVNRTLEENQVPVFWLSNSASLDPAFIRRFDMVIELPIPPKQQRKKIVQAACGDMLDAVSVARIAEVENLSPAVISRAASVIRCIEGEIDKSKLSSAIEYLVSNTLEAQGHRMPKYNDANQLSDTYDLAFIHSDVDLATVSQGLATSKSGRMCLYGPPGTGKTAYTRWLSDQLDVPLLVKRGSDLISCWVGGTEQNIAHAFKEAEQEKALLLIDEVDGFLQDRRNAQRSWEVTAVNELLTQMESYSGLFIASTNMMGNLDQAALRRFDLKVKFDYLKPDQASNLLVRQCESLGFPPPTKSDQQELSRLTTLTPGDFTAVVRQHRFRPMSNAVELVAALKKECEVKEDGIRIPIGFH